MPASKGMLRLELTKQQQQEDIRIRMGKTAEAIELTVEELEARIAPTKMWSVNNFKVDLGGG